MARSGWAVWVAVAALSLCATLAAAQNVKVGVIGSYSGFLAQGGDEMQKGIDLYATLHRHDLPPGVSVELIRRDDSSVAETGKRLAQELVTREHVQILLGVIGSPIAAAIAPVTEEAKVPLIITGATGAALPRLSPYIVRLSFTLWQTAFPLGKWTADQGWKTAFTAVSDFIPGHDAEAAFTKAFTDSGGKIVGSIRFSPSSPDFAPVVQRIRDVRPDVAFIWVPGGAQATAVMKAIRDLRLREAGVNIVSTQELVPDVELANLGDAPVGLVTAGNYSAASERSANRSFVAAMDREYRFVPGLLAVAGWDGMHAIYDLVAKTKGQFTGDAAMEFLASWKDPDSPRGPTMIDPATRDIVQNIYIRRTEMRDGKLANVEFFTMPAVKDPWKELNPPK